MKAKIAQLFTLILISGLTVFISCGKDDDPDNPNQIVIDGEAYSLEGLEIYLIAESSGYYGPSGVRENGQTDSHTYRDYYISDGTWSGSGFQGSTFIMLVEIAVPVNSSFTTGNYPNHYFWSNIDLSSNISYFYFDGANDVYVESPQQGDHEPLKLSGGFNDGQNFKVSFEGAVDGSESNISLYYEGVINDVRGTNARVLNLDGPSSR